MLFQVTKVILSSSKWDLENDTKEALMEAYNTNAYNCYITGTLPFLPNANQFVAAIYAGTLVFSVFQVYVNNNRSYQMV